MKKHLIAAAVAAAFAVPAMAQVTLGGGINVGIMDTGAAGASAAVSSLGGGANAINISTAEDLGGGMEGGFTGQMRFSAVTGDRTSAGTGNALLHAANLYLSGGFGTLRLGKIAEAGNCGFDPWGCTGGAALSAGVGVSALIAAGTTANAVSYASPTISGLSLGLQSSVSTRNNERQVYNVNFSQGPITAQFLQSRSSGNTAADPALAMTTTTPYENTPLPALTTAPITDVAGRGTSLGLSFNAGVATFSLVNAVTKNAAGTKTADVMSVGATVPLGAITVLAGYNKNDSAAATADTKWALGANYALSKRTTVGADVFHAEAVNSSTGFVVRARHTF